MANKEENPNAIFDGVTLRTAVGNDGHATVGVSLECDDPVNLALSKPLQVITKESLSTPSPMLIVTFLDAHGDLMNAKKLDSAAGYELKMESYEGSTSISRWKMSHIEHKNTVIGESSQGTFSVHFVHETWKDFAYLIKCRGWKNKKYSDVVNEIANECGFDVTDIVDTKETIETIQQPNWTNAKMVRWIMSRCTPSDGSGEYEYAISIDGKFVFAPLSSFINQEFQLRESVTDPVEIYLGNRPYSNDVGGKQNQVNSKIKKKRDSDNPSTSYSATNYMIVENSSDDHKQGAGGVVNSWYNFDNAEYKREKMKYSESSNLQLSEWSLVNQDYEDSPLFLFHGRNAKEAETIGENRITNVVNAMQKVRVIIPAAPNIKAGEIVEFTIPNPDKYKDYQGVSNEFHSGNYIVHSVTNNIDASNKAPMFNTELLLVRQGVDKKEVDYYTKSSGGKA